MLVALFIGNLAADAVLQKGNSDNFLSFRAASSRKYTDPKTGQPVEFTQWVTVNINRNYDNIAQYLTKGTKVFVEGQFATRIYQDRSGMSQVGLTINASRIELCGQPAVQPQQPQHPEQYGQQPQQPAQYSQQPPRQPQYRQQPQQPAQYAQQPPLPMPAAAPVPPSFAVPPSESDMYNNEPF